MIPRLTGSPIPVNLEAAARSIGIEQILEFDSVDADGLLNVTRAGTYVVGLRRSQSAVRRRFTLAHELGHMIVLRSIGRPDFPQGPAQLSCRATTAEEKDEERLCDLLATEILMPREQFLRSAEETGICARSIPGIAAQFGVSLMAASRRLTETSPYEMGIGLWFKRDDDHCIVPKWYFSRRGPRVLENTIAADSTGSSCFTDQAVRGWRWIPLQGPMDRYFVDVCPLGSAGAWLMMVVFDTAAEHIMSTLRAAPSRSMDQFRLMDD
jgi:hypothetical protein